MTDPANLAPSWPFLIRFTKDNFDIEFQNEIQLREWLAKERAFWTRLVAGQNLHFADAASQNLKLLPQSTAPHMRLNMLGLAEVYRPSEGEAGTIVSRAGEDNTAACIAFSEIVKQGSIQQQGSPSYQWGRALAAVYYALGGQLPSLKMFADLQFSLRESLQEVAAVRATDEAALEKIATLAEKSQEDWNNRIEGYEAKIALSAPREYWRTRESYHRDKAVIARREWFWSLLAVAILVPAGLLYWLWHSTSADIANAIISAVQRIVAFGTIMAFAVWWLRQKLRDLRTHEHLAEDAAERVTMIETYAAMRGAGMQGADLAPILTALYRSAATPSSDDHGPVLPIELLLRAVGDASTKK